VFSIPYTCGRLVQNVSELALPPSLATDMSNVDISVKDQASKRDGYIRALSVSYGGKVALLHKYKDIDGTEVYITISPDGVNRET